MSVRAIEAGATSERRPCKACNGSKRAGVPGAYLAPRGEHLEFK
jgi:hypothetical protein